MGDEKAAGRAARAKCAAGLAMIVLFAAIGADERTHRKDSAAETIAPAAAQFSLEDHEDGFDSLPQATQMTAAPGRLAAEDQVQQHRKQVYEERRGRFNGSEPRSVAAGATHVAN